MRTRASLRRVAVAALLPLIAGCGRTDDGRRTDPRPGAPSPGGAVAADGLQRLTAFGDLWAPVPLKVAYGFSTGAGGSAATGTVLLSRRSETAWRIDLEVGGGASVLIRDGEASYVCTGSSEGGSCLRSETPERIPTPVPAPFLPFLTSPDTLREDIERRAGTPVLSIVDPIAGEPATCFRTTGAAPAAEWCFTDDGILLRMLAEAPEADEGFRLEATSLQRKVTDEDLAPPYPATEARP